MKVPLSLLAVFGAATSFAAEVRIEPAVVDSALYTRAQDAEYQSELVYNGEAVDPAVVQVQNAGLNSGTCTRFTPVGVPCMCNSGIYRNSSYINQPGWHADERMRAVRDGWHVTYLKGQHGGGMSCMRDRMPTPEERARYHATGK